MQFLGSMECHIVRDCIYIDIVITNCYWQRIVICNCNFKVSFGWFDVIVAYGLDVIVKYREGVAMICDLSGMSSSTHFVGNTYVLVNPCRCRSIAADIRASLQGTTLI